MNQKTKMKYTSEKGITLIALVITIIVLLILAGVTINMVLGDDGIIKQAQAAKQAQEDANTEDKEAIEDLEEFLGNYISEEDPDEEDPEDNTPKELTTEEVATLTNGKISNATTGVITEIKVFNGEYVPIPKTMTYVTGASVDEGVVVKDEYENEFVWVPVDTSANNTTPMFTENADGTYKGKMYNWYTGVAVVESDSESVEPSATGLNLSEIGNADLQKEYDDMVESVKTYGGFYVGRYETSWTGTRVASLANKAAMNTDSYDDWYTFYNRQKVLHEGSTSVVSGMIYGSQWDAIMNWMSDITNVNEPTKLYINYAEDMGYYDPKYDQGSPVVTGYYAVKNIYDLAGNHCEWTQEYSQNLAEGIGWEPGRYVRSGDWYRYSAGEDYSSASIRLDPTQKTSSRLQLYIK